MSELDKLNEVLDNMEAVVTVESGSPLFKRLQVWSQEMTNKLLSSLDSKVKGTQGALRQSITFLPKETSEGIEVVLSMQDYYKYIDQGVSGVRVKYSTPFSYSNKRPPTEALKSWSSNKGLNEWAVRESVFQKGIKPNYFYSSVIDKDEILTELSNIIKETVENGNNS